MVFTTQGGGGVHLNKDLSVVVSWLLNLNNNTT